MSETPKHSMRMWISRLIFPICLHKLLHKCMIRTKTFWLGQQLKLLLPSLVGRTVAGWVRTENRWLLLSLPATEREWEGDSLGGEWRQWSSVGQHTNTNGDHHLSDLTDNNVTTSPDSVKHLRYVDERWLVEKRMTDGVLKMKDLLMSVWDWKLLQPAPAVQAVCTLQFHCQGWESRKPQR